MIDRRHISGPAAACPAGKRNGPFRQSFPANNTMSQAKTGHADGGGRPARTDGRRSGLRQWGGVAAQPYRCPSRSQRRCPAPPINIATTTGRSRLQRRTQAVAAKHGRPTASRCRQDLAVEPPVLGMEGGNPHAGGGCRGRRAPVFQVPPIRPGRSRRRCTPQTARMGSPSRGGAQSRAIGCNPDDYENR